MLESFVEANIFYPLLAGAVFLGVVCKLIVSMSLRKLVKEASNMSKSNHGFMRLVKAKFEHAYLVNNTVENIPIFVEKYIHEYRVLWMGLHRWQRLEKFFVVVVAILTALAAGGAYMFSKEQWYFTQVLAIGVGAIILLLGVYQLTDEKYRLSALKIYMVDYLENAYSVRMKKKSTERKEIHQKEAAQHSQQQKRENKQRVYVTSEQKNEVEVQVPQVVEEEEKSFVEKVAMELENSKKEELTESVVVNNIEVYDKPKHLVEKEEKEEKEKKKEEQLSNESVIRDILQEFLA